MGLQNIINPDAFTHVCRAEEYKDKGDYNQAIIEYNKAIQIDPGFAFLYSGRGQAYYDKNEFDRAIKDFNEALQLNIGGDNAQVSVTYMLRGITYVAKKEYKLAIADYDKAIEIDQNNAGAYVSYGSMYWIIGDQDQSDGNFDRAIINYNKAITKMETAIQIDPDLGYVKNVLESVRQKLKIAETRRK